VLLTDGFVQIARVEAYTGKILDSQCWDKIGVLLGIYSCFTAFTITIADFLVILFTEAGSADNDSSQASSGSFPEKSLFKFNITVSVELSSSSS